MSSPLQGHVDAPFYTAIDRRRAKFSLPLNTFLLDVLSETAASAASELTPFAHQLGRTAIFDLAAWDPDDTERLERAWESLGEDWSEAKVVPSAEGGDAWTSIRSAWTWSETGYRLFRIRRLIKAGVRDLADPVLGTLRMDRLARLTKAAEVISSPDDAVLAEWTEAIARSLQDDRSNYTTWSTFYDETKRAFESVSALKFLVGKRFLKGRDDQLHVATGVDGGRRHTPRLCPAGRCFKKA